MGLRLGMGLAEEIEESIIQAAKRTPWVLELLTSDDFLGELVSQFRDKTPEQANVEFQIALLNITEAQRFAIVRLAREIEALKESHDL